MCSVELHDVYAGQIACIVLKFDLSCSQAEIQRLCTNAVLGCMMPMYAALFQCELGVNFIVARLNLRADSP